MNSASILLITFMILNSNKQSSEARNLGYTETELTTHDELEAATKDVIQRETLAEEQSEHSDDNRVKLRKSGPPELNTLTAPISDTNERPCCSPDSDNHTDVPQTDVPVNLELRPSEDEGYYCPDKQRWLHQDTLIRGSTLEATSVIWEEGDMLVQCVPSVTEYNCIKVGFKSGTHPGVISLSGWSISGGSSSNSDGYVYEYYGLYNSLANKWETFGDCNGTTVFSVGIDTPGPELEKVAPTVTTKELMLCPMKVSGKHPLLHLSVKGCLMRKHGPMERFTLPEKLKGKETCLLDECWMNEEDAFEPCMFYSNAGGYAPSAMYSDEGYPFPALADTGPLIGHNSEYFLEVDFPKINSVSELKICGGSARGEKGAIKSFTLAYRDMYAQGRWTYVQNKEGSLMYFEEKTSDSPSAWNHSCPYDLDPPLITAGIRIYPQTWMFAKPYLRLDIKACQIHTSGTCDDEDVEDTQLSNDIPLAFLDPLPVDVNNELAGEMDIVQPPDSRGVARVGPRDIQNKDTR